MRFKVVKPKPKTTKSKTKTKTVRGKKMSDETKPAEITTLTAEDVSKRDLKNGGVVEIRGEQGSVGKLEIYIRHRALAEVVAKMSMGNFGREEFDKVYAPCLMDYPDPKAKEKGRVVTRPAIYAATKNIEPATDFDFARPPRGILLANPDALEKGFSIIISIKTPVPQDTLRRWGKQLMDGCADIIAASKAFRMSWVMIPTETNPGHL